MIKEIIFSALLISGGITGCLAILACSRLRKTGATEFAALMVAVTVYSFGYALELFSGTLAGVVFWLRVEYLGISLLPAFWVIFALRFTGRDRWLSAPTLSFLFFLAAVTMVLHYTNSYHHFFYKEVALDTSGPFPRVQLEKGPWYWVHIGYIYLAAILGNAAFFAMSRRIAPVYRRQALLILVGSFAPWVGNLVYLAGFSPLNLDLSPFAFAISGVMYAWGLFHYRIFDLAPVAHHQVFNGILDGVVVVDDENRLVDYNLAAENILGQLSRDRIGAPVEEVLRAVPVLVGQIAGAAAPEDRIRVPGPVCDRYYRSRLSPLLNRGGRIVGKIAILTDITENVRLVDELHKLASVDELTAAFNRRSFWELSQQSLIAAAREGQPVAGIIYDLDNFKTINDNYGHRAGDIVLREATHRVMSLLRETDIYGRIGGEEFAIFLPGATQAEAVVVAERLRESLAADPVDVDGLSVCITASFGVAGAGDAGLSVDELIRRADDALYVAKESGRNRVQAAVATPAEITDIKTGGTDP